MNSSQDNILSRFLNTLSKRVRKSRRISVVIVRRVRCEIIVAFENKIVFLVIGHFISRYFYSTKLKASS